MRHRLAAALVLACMGVTEALPAKGNAADLVTTAEQYEGTNPGHWGFAWCAAFIRSILPQAGLAAPLANNMAASFLSLPRTSPHRGAIAVVGHRGRITHVAIVVETAPGGVVLLSGNGRGHVVHRGFYPSGSVAAYVEPLPASAAAAPAMAAIGRALAPGRHRHAVHRFHHRHHHRRHDA